MAFKKSKGKTGKKKPKKSGGKKDEWSHEGGQVLDGREEENQDNSGKRIRRTSQEKDEQLRRGKLKHDDRKRKLKFKAKMSKKVKFDDILDKPEEMDTAAEQTNQKVSRRREFPANPLPVMERLKFFVSKSKQARADGDSSSDDDNDEEEEEGEEEDEEEGSGGESNSSASERDEEESGEEAREKSSEVKKAKGGNHAVITSDVADQDVEDIAVEEDDEDDDSSDEVDGTNKKKKSIGALNGDFYYDNIFNRVLERSGANELKTKMKLLCKIDGSSDELYGNVDFSTAEGDVEQTRTTSMTVLPVCPGPYISVNQMPGLYKLFRTPSACARIDDITFNEGNSDHINVNPFLLPYVSTYADAFIEGRDHHNDASYVQGMLLHAVAHTVKAR